MIEREGVERWVGCPAQGNGSLGMGEEGWNQSFLFLHLLWLGAELGVARDLLAQDWLGWEGQRTDRGLENLGGE